MTTLKNEIKNNYPLVVFIIIWCIFIVGAAALPNYTGDEKTMLELNIELTKLKIKKLKGECPEAIK